MDWEIDRCKRVVVLMLMLALVSLGYLIIGFANAQTQAKPSEIGAQQKIDPEIAEKLLKVKRIYVDSFGDDGVSKQIQAMVINALSESKRFIITENKDKADAILKGAGLEKTSQELHSSSDATSVGAAAGSHSGSIHGSIANGTGSISGSESGRFAARHMGTSDAVASTETINDARIAVRLVSSDGDVLWTASKESHGAKYKGASADVADMVVKQFLNDLDKLKPATR